MASVIDVNFSVDELLKGKIDELIKQIINKFKEVGERCVAQARDKGSYTDRTSNLRNSVGYVVLYNGVVQGKSRIKVAQSQKFLEELIPRYQKGIVLIVVAGMNYAVYVEAKNFDVLTSAELLAERIVPKMLRDLGFKI